MKHTKQSKTAVYRDITAPTHYNIITQTLSCYFRMTDSEDKLMEVFASDLIVSTCQTLPKLYSLVSDRLRTPIPSVYLEPIDHSWFCGSSAEFYIRPLNPCIGDTDKLYSSVNKMAFTEDIPVLPDCINYLADTFQCYKID